jgi:hypothetical protein
VLDADGPHGSSRAAGNSAEAAEVVKHGQRLYGTKEER